MPDTNVSSSPTTAVNVPPVYGGLEGPESMYLKLISSDNHDFVVRRDFAINASPTIKNMLSGPGQYSDSQMNEIYLKDIPSHVLIHVCRYLSYRAKYTNSSIDIPEFPIDTQVVLELLVASDFLDC
ncbi:unnamed protein product [Didymodactylos carnosus]|uniref:Elongin-C n=1 Tax=Didymodactylos carnosus TaxID=1234261 RepID=A0A814H3C3_9BILA|nr:unnamed protein product [Didymodactylos carnosus]CAF1004365.1 unnamed protein product [Didymodactylos carnosus]CAF3563796.1 unnamed protein product [Didymodactylos carnosus]CAF3775716.1 unnamed protein product [Didymodactylos carnosus]